MVGSMILFVLCIMIYILISDVITVLFRLTGMSAEKAHFQAISLLTNSGFTTKESEIVVVTKLRRRLARVTMLFGYAFTVTIVSAMVNVFMSMSKSELGTLLYWLPSLGLALGVFYLVRRWSLFRTWFDSLIERWGNRIMFGKGKNKVILVEDYGNLVVAHIYLQIVPEELAEKPLSQSDIRAKHHINILMVKSRGAGATQAGADTVLRPHDIIMVMGPQRAIRSFFEGEREHTRDDTQLFRELGLGTQDED